MQAFGATLEEEEASRREQVSREPCNQFLSGKCTFGSQCFRSHDAIPVVAFIEQMLVDQNRSWASDTQFGAALKTWASSEVNQVSLLDEVLRVYSKDGFPSMQVKGGDRGYLELVFRQLWKNGIVHERSFLRWVESENGDKTDYDSEDKQQALEHLSSFLVQIREGGDQANQDVEVEEEIYDDDDEDDDDSSENGDEDTLLQDCTNQEQG